MTTAIVEGPTTARVKAKRHAIRASARARALEFALSSETVRMLLLAPRCGYCGLMFGKHVERTVERIDAALGYVPGNVAAVCLRCNQKKSRGEDRRRARKRKEIAR